MVYDCFQFDLFRRCPCSENSIQQLKNKYAAKKIPAGLWPGRDIILTILTYFNSLQVIFAASRWAFNTGTFPDAHFCRSGSFAFFTSFSNSHTSIL